MRKNGATPRRQRHRPDCRDQGRDAPNAGRTSAGAPESDRIRELATTGLESALHAIGVPEKLAAVVSKFLAPARLPTILRNNRGSVSLAAAGMFLGLIAICVWWIARPMPIDQSSFLERRVRAAFVRDEERLRRLRPNGASISYIFIFDSATMPPELEGMPPATISMSRDMRLSAADRRDLCILVETKWQLLQITLPFLDTALSLENTTSSVHCPYLYRRTITD